VLTFSTYIPHSCVSMYICIAVDSHHPNIPNASLETPSFPSDTKMLAHVDFMDPTISGEGTGWTKAAQVVAVSIEQNESSLLRELIGDTETAEGEGVQQEEEESEVEEGMGKREARQDAMNEGMGRNRAVPYPRHPAPRPPTSAPLLSLSAPGAPTLTLHLPASSSAEAETSLPMSPHPVSMFSGHGLPWFMRFPTIDQTSAQTSRTNNER